LAKTHPKNSKKPTTSRFIMFALYRVKTSNDFYAIGHTIQ